MMLYLCNICVFFCQKTQKIKEFKTKMLIMLCLLLIITIKKGVINMNILKKVGLTALGTSLIATSAFAGAMDVTGSAGITLSKTKQTKVMVCQ